MGQKVQTLFSESIAKGSSGKVVAFCTVQLHRAIEGVLFLDEKTFKVDGPDGPVGGSIVGGPSGFSPLACIRKVHSKMHTASTE